MAKKLTHMTWEQLKSEMSIACDAENVVKLGKQVDALIRPRLDWTNVVEVEMMELALKYVIANLRGDRLEMMKQSNF